MAAQTASSTEGGHPQARSRGSPPMAYRFVRPAFLAPLLRNTWFVIRFPAFVIRMPLSEWRSLWRGETALARRVCATDRARCIVEGAIAVPVELDLHLRQRGAAVRARGRGQRAHVRP